MEAAEAAVLDQATAASTIAELEAETASLERLEALAGQIRRSGADTKWRELSNLLAEVFTPAGLGADFQVAEDPAPYGSGPIPPPVASPGQKPVVFTEHRDTLDYLQQRIGTLLGRPGAIAVIRGGVGREERRRAQEAFLHDRRVQVLIATDAAGEGINLQRAHLMVNYDLPWNPNRLEQRFGRIHRIGQTEVCHLWSLVAAETREGDVYRPARMRLNRPRAGGGGLAGGDRPRRARARRRSPRPARGVAGPDVVSHLDNNFFRVRFDRLPPLEQKYLRAMAELGPGPFATGRIAETLGTRTASVAAVRQRLINKGMVWSRRHGETSFTVPMFDGFMKRQMPELLKHAPQPGSGPWPQRSRLSGSASSTVPSR